MYRIVLNNETKTKKHRVFNLPELPVVVASPDGVIWLKSVMNKNHIEK